MKTTMKTTTTTTTSRPLSVMKSSVVFLLVLVFSSLSSGQNDPTPSPAALSPAPRPPDESPDRTSNFTSSPTSANNHTTMNDTASQGEPTQSAEETTVGVNGSTAATPIPVTRSGKEEEEDGGGGGGMTVTVSMATGSTTQQPVQIEGGAGSSWGYVILVVIFLMIIALCIILYFLRRISRSYSFDLQRPNPVTRLDEPTGTFEPVYLDDLDGPASKHQVTSAHSPPVTNGTKQQTGEKGTNGDTVPHEEPGANGLDTSPTRVTSETGVTGETSETSETRVTSETSETSETSGPAPEPPAEKTCSRLSGSSILLFDGDEQQNVNNNNPSLRSSDPFVEINLDDPAWCDQLLTSPAPPSSVLPFSPFSFSSSSSSSSSSLAS